jgi:hypothetical protein
MSVLREEIIESEKIRSELLKWKLIIVSVLGATGLGFTEYGKAPNANLVLLVIPLACVYVDLLCRHINLRIIAIGTFIRLGFCGEEAAYENFILETTKMGPKKNMSIFALEDWALDGSTVLLSVLVIVAGLILPNVAWILFAISGSIGIGATALICRRCSHRIAALNQLKEDQEIIEKLRSIMVGSGLKPSVASGSSTTTQ